MTDTTDTSLVSAATPSPERYSHGHHEAVLRSHRWRTAANSAAYLLPRLRPTDRLLDVGIGPGSITVELAQRLTDGWVTGIDNAPAAVEAARSLAVAIGAERLTLETGDVYHLAYEDEAFDVVHAHQVLQHLADPVAALREMRRVCRPGGVVAARDADYAVMTWWPEVPDLDRWLELYHQVARTNGSEPDAGRRLRSWALEAGFGVVRSSGSVWCFSDADDVDWWSDTWAHRVTESDFARQAVEYGLSDPAELARIADAWRTWAAAPDAWFAILHGEILATPVAIAAE